MAPLPEPVVSDPVVPEPMVPEGEALELELELDPVPGPGGTLEGLEVDPLPNDPDPDMDPDVEPEPGAGGGELGAVLLEELVLPVPEEDAGRRSSPQAASTPDKPTSAAIANVLFNFMLDSFRMEDRRLCGKAAAALSPAPE
jgi:hypothetical protein